MSKKIEVGMLVRIVHVNDPRGIEPPNELKRYVGHIGKALSEGTSRIGRRMFDIEGTNTEAFWFAEDQLQPIDQESDDIKATREQGAPSFSKMMEGLKQREEV